MRKSTDAVVAQVSLMLHDLPQFTQEPKEYILHKATRDIAQPGDAVSQGTSNTFIFSEKDMPGFKSRAIHTLAGKGQGQMVQGRSFLYEDNQKEMKRKENRKRWEPYGRKAIPSRSPFRRLSSCCSLITRSGRANVHHRSCCT